MGGSPRTFTLLVFVASANPFRGQIVNSSKLMKVIWFSFLVLMSGCGRVDESAQQKITGLAEPGLPKLLASRLPGELQGELGSWIEIQAKRAGFELQWAEPGQADLIWFSPTQLVEQIGDHGEASASFLASVPEDWTKSRSSLRYEDLIPWIRDRVISWKQVPVALPIVGEGYVLAYRKDVLADLKAKNPGLPEGAPGSWTDFLKVAEALAKVSPSKKSGFSPLGNTPGDRERFFLMIHASIAARGISIDEKTDGFSETVIFGYLYDLKSGAFQPGTEATAEAARIWASLNALSVKGDIDPIEQFLSGETALGILPLSALARAANRPELVGKIGIGQIPGSLVYADSAGKLVNGNRPNYRPMLGSGGVLVGVRAGSPRAEAAWKLAAALASPPGEYLALGNRTAGATRNEQILRLRWDRFNLDTKATSYLREILREQLLVTAVKNPAPYPRRPDGAERTALLAQLLENVRDESSAKALPDAWIKGIAEIEQRNQKQNNSVGNPLEIARWSVGLIP